MDIEFDFRLDSRCGDPDADSPKLYEAHQALWNRNLPCGKCFNLSIYRSSYSRLLLKNGLIDNLSSDRMCPHFDGTYKVNAQEWMSTIARNDFKYKVRTIGGHIIFPAHRRKGFTINQARGINRKICDRFDLTLECIRLHYLKTKNPLFNVLQRYQDFFELFNDFNGYVEFFLLQDFIDDSQTVKFCLPFDEFNRSALPQSKEEYFEYQSKTVALINARNRRIAKLF